MSEITGAILAGGLGTRLRSVVSDRPKVLATVLGKPFLAYLLDQLAQAGVDRVVLLTGYRGEQIQQEFGNRYGRLALDYSTETSPLGTAGALRLALPKLFPAVASGQPNEPSGVLVLNGDSYCQADLRLFRAFHEHARADASLVLAQVTDTSRFGKVQMTSHHRLERFLEKQEAGGAGEINAGIYLINRELIEEIPEGRPVSIEREMFPSWLQTHTLLGFGSIGSFLDIGTPESYREAEAFFGQMVAGGRLAAHTSSLAKPA
jgi:D-glycero-alpha-D-manno-heptose 1-phosphate guanylyltransferase